MPTLLLQRKRIYSPPRLLIRYSPIFGALSENRTRIPRLKVVCSTIELTEHIVVRATGLEPARLPTWSLAMRVCQFHHARIVWGGISELN